MRKESAASYVYMTHQFCWYTTAVTGAVVLGLGYRDGLVVGTALFSLMMGLYTTLKRKEEREEIQRRKRTAVREFGMILTLGVVGFLTAFATADNVRLAATTATIQKDAGGYVTIQRCSKRGEDEVCLHESAKHGVIMYYLNKGNVVAEKDMTDVVNKARQGKDVGVERATDGKE